MKKKFMLFVLIATLSSNLFGESKTKLVVRSVNINGVHSLNSFDLLRVIRTKPSSVFNKEYFDRRLVKFDAISLKTFCISQGFLSSTVKDSVVIQDESVNIYFNIIEGDQVILKQAKVLGNYKILESRILDILSLKVNNPYNPIALNKNLSELNNEYQRFGKLFNKINVYESVEDSAEIMIEINEGKDVYIKSFSIEGIEGINHYLAERELTFNKGEIYHKDKIDHSQRRLLETGIFSFAQISPAPISGSDSTAHLTIHMKQFKPREWQSIGGYYPIEYYEGAEPLPGAGAEIGWRNRSINASTTNLNINLAGYLIPSQDYFYPKITFNINIGNQWFLKRRIPTQIGYFLENFKPYGQFKDSFIARYGFQIVNQNNLTERSYLLSELKWEKFSETKNLEHRTYKLTSYIDRTDHPIISTSGYRLTGMFHMSGGILGGSKSFYKIDLGFNHYSIIVNNYIFAGRYKIGKIFGWDSSNSDDPQFDLFYLGGSSSLRGWDMMRFQIDEDTGNPSGDVFRIISNWEIRFPIFWIVGGELFIDGGMLSDKLNQDELKNYLWNGGFGITIETPLAPFRLDFATPFDGTDTWKIQMGANYIF
ncbi:MAG TPA: BamA/TamA family outer membrane protein [Candidatus Marinimicrobia bacterium]|jgi:outer membrane protein insertion porin family|nr:BamA/TamA family outer membrane protein [Candidatus Neomarinimicrobiota bacterium]|tara:strand:+ start:498 stop:2282 length:1785 start_codon:yes stop_codon:yes gene_type:complete